jgi:L-alanine-DL-glutamate epimerase-like enolase superfamily enzyme
MIPIADLSVAVLRESDRPVDNAGQCALVLVTAADGTVGYGEANANPAAIKALLETDFGLAANWDEAPRTTLLGADATDPVGTWELLTRSSSWSCRTGLGHVAIAGIDMALWDLAGKLAGAPSWRLMGGEPRTPEAYVTVYHASSSFAETWARARDGLDWVAAAGFQAAKIEALPGNAPSATDVLSFVELSRQHVGKDMTLILDVGYRWRRVEDALETARLLDDCTFFALEAPYPPELVAEYHKLQDVMSTPIATGDILTSFTEYLPLLGSGALQYVQAGASRTGMSEMGRLARAAAAVDRSLIPWGWVATGLATAANVHVAMCHSNIPLIEYAPPDLYCCARLRNTLCRPEPAHRNGRFSVPERPGLGTEIDPDALRQFSVDL